MADTVPPAKVQIEQLTSFKKDVELTLLGLGDAGSPEVHVSDVHDWLQRALESSTDAAVALTLNTTFGPPGALLMQGGFEPVSVLTQLDAKVTARIAELTRKPGQPKLSVQAWLVDSLVEIMKDRARLHVKSNDVRAADVGEVRAWLEGKPPPPHQMTIINTPGY